MRKPTCISLIIIYSLITLSACQNKSANTETPRTKIRASLEAFAFTECQALMEDDSSCACDFRPQKDNFKTSLLVSDMEDNACIKVNGNILNLKGERIDERLALEEQAYMENWITLKEGGIYQIFGADASQREYEENRAILIEALLVMDEMPAEIPMQFVGTTGMGMRAELRDMATEAMEMAKKARAEGNTGVPMQILYQNDQFEVLITAYVDGRNDSGGNTYAGTIELKSKDGDILDTKHIWGGCDC